MKKNKKLQELKDNELEQVTGGKSLPPQVMEQYGQFVKVAPLIMEFDTGLGKAYASQPRKAEDEAILMSPNTAGNR